MIVTINGNNNSDRTRRRKRKTDKENKIPYNIPKTLQSKILNELVQTHPVNVKIICDYITAEQNELNIKDSTKNTKIKRKTCTFIQIL